MNQSKTMVNPARTSNAGKTPQAIMSEAQIAMDESEERGAAWYDWFSNSNSQIEEVGTIACWKDGLILAMQVCEASFKSQDSLESAFNECGVLLKSNRELLASLTSSGGSAEGLSELIAESDSTMRQLARSMANERARSEKFLRNWDQLAGLVASWYALPTQAICQFDGYVPVETFGDRFGNVFDSDDDFEME
jgi:hypothetical protein